MDKEICDSFIIVMIGLIGLGIYHLADDHKEMERYFHSRAKIKYYVFNFTYGIILLAITINVRFLLSRFIQTLKK